MAANTNMFMPRGPAMWLKKAEAAQKKPARLPETTSRQIASGPICLFKTSLCNRVNQDFNV